jgi:hypothetical protein
MSVTDYSTTGNLVSDIDITKLVTPQGNQTLSISGTSKYIYFAYPSIYGNLNKIYDGNGFDVTSAFTKYTRNQNGSAGSWTGISYYIYKTDTTTVSPAQNYVFTY